MESLGSAGDDVSVIYETQRNGPDKSKKIKMFTV